jgi:signal transduction histidine kinase
VRWIAETGDVIRDASGAAVRMVGVVQDVTERKKAQIEIHKLNEQLEQRVIERTAELTEANRQLREEMRRRKRLEQEILAISEREQTKIGRELHDSLGQQLTGIAIMAKVLQQRLETYTPEDAARAGELVKLISRAIEETRQLSRGLHPVALDENGLMSALQSMALATEGLPGVTCVFECDQPVPVRNASMAVHLYRIAQEAVSNAIRHGQAKRIAISLTSTHSRATLSIVNDGRRFPKRLPRTRGMGLQVMGYRAEVIGGILNVRQGPIGGTQVTCDFDVKPKRRKGAKKDAAQDAEHGHP